MILLKQIKIHLISSKHDRIIHILRDSFDYFILSMNDLLINTNEILEKRAAEVLNKVIYLCMNTLPSDIQPDYPYNYPMTFVQDVKFL